MTVLIEHFLAIGLVLMTYLMTILAKDITLHPRENWAVVPVAATDIDRPKIQILFELSFQDSAIQEVLLIKNRHLIVERYALGEDANSSDPSWGMTKSLYAALIEISIDRDEIDRLDDPVVKYLDYFHNEPRHIRVRDLLDMTSGLDFPAHEY